MGGTLTNWPAVGDLKPIEFTAQHSEGGTLYQFMYPDEALEDYAQRVRRAFYEQYSPVPPNAGQVAAPNDGVPVVQTTFNGFVRSVHDGYVLVINNDRTWQVPFKEGDGGAITFDPVDNWQEVRLVPQPVESTPNGDLMEESMPDVVTTTETPPAVPQLDLASIEADVRAKVITELASAIGVSGGGDVEAAAEALKTRLAALNVSNIVDLSAARDQLLAGVKDVMAQEYSRIKEQGGQIVAQMMQEFQRDRSIHEFAMAFTEGHNGNRYGLPLQTGRVEAFLRTLSATQFTEAVGILGEVARTGVVDFAAIGTTGSGRFRHPLPDDIQKQLDNGSMTLADLSTPIIKPLLSRDLSEYDLSRWDKSGGK